MFRTCISGCTRAIASASKHIHTSAVFFSQAAKRTGARNKKINQNKTKRRNKVAASSRPSVVLGTRPWEEEEKWKDCRLAQVLVNEEALSGTDLVKTKLTIGEVDVPKQLGYGVDRAEKMMLLDSLPVVTAHMATADKIKALQQQGKVDPDEYRKDVYKKDIAKQLHQTNMFAKVLDLQNANAAGIAYVNRQRIIKAFSTSKNPFDTGRTEVQVALLTYKIRHLWKHLTTFKRDVGNRRNLRLLVHKRARMLRYLKRESRDRYETLLPMLALEPESVEGELVI